jgi:hypothetical protein
MTMTTTPTSTVPAPKPANATVQAEPPVSPRPQTATTIKRAQNWQTLLHEFLETRARQPFAWGANDCALFAADAVQAMTGKDLGAAFRGKYSTQAEAEAQMTATCGSADALALAAHLCQQAGLPPRSHVNFAQRGDVIALKNPDGSHSLGIVALSGVHALFVTEGGLRRMRVRDCVAAWQVGA